MNWLWVAVRFLISLFLAIVLMLWIDPAYFDMPIAAGDAGLPASSAPPGPFTTSVGVKIPDSRYPVLIMLAARDSPVDGRMEFLDPRDQPIFSQQISLPRNANSPAATWVSLNVPTGEAGRHTVRLTQNQPGTIALYFYQGPFLARLIGLPMVLLLLNGIFAWVRWKRRTEKTPQPAIVATG